MNKMNYKILVFPVYSVKNTYTLDFVCKQNDIDESDKCGQWRDLKEESTAHTKPQK